MTDILKNDLDKFLKETSQEVDSKVLQDLSKLFQVEGRLQEAGIGSIRIVRRREEDRNDKDQPKTKLRTKSGEAIAKTLSTDGLQVRKTVCLDKQNYQALVKSLDSKMKTLRGVDGSVIVQSDASKSQVRKWTAIYGHAYKGDSQVSKVAQVQRGLPKARDGATRLVLCNEFLNEAAIGKIVTEHLCRKAPHFVGQKASQIHEGFGNLILDFAGYPFEKTCMDFSIPEAKSVILQTLVALAIGSKVCHMKHHDMHLENIFVSKLKEDSSFKSDSEDIDLSKTKQWSQTFNSEKGPQTIQIQHHGLLARIGDQGLSSITDPTTQTRIERIDYEELNAAELEWGRWNGCLEENPLYDIVTLLSKFCLPEECEQVPPFVAGQFRSLFMLLQRDQNIRASVIGRPLAYEWQPPQEAPSFLDLFHRYLPEAFLCPMNPEDVTEIYREV